MAEFSENFTEEKGELATKSEQVADVTTENMENNSVTTNAVSENLAEASESAEVTSEAREIFEDDEVCENREESLQKLNSSNQTLNEEFLPSNESEKFAKNEKRPQEKESVLSIITTVVLAFLCIALIFVKFVWFYCVEVDGDSMNATLTSGDFLLVDKLAEVDRGDVVVFTLNEKAYIKRAVALEGDTVKITGGKVYVKKAGEEKFELSEYEGVIGSTNSHVGLVFEKVISKGCIFVLGDNRENSTDSRILGEIDLQNVDGVVHQFIIDKKDGALGKIYKFI